MSTEQCTNYMFSVLLHKTTIKTLTLLEEAYGEEAIKKIQLYALHKHLSGGHDNIKYDVRNSGRPQLHLLLGIKKLLGTFQRQSYVGSFL